MSRWRAAAATLAVSAALGAPRAARAEGALLAPGDLPEATRLALVSALRTNRISDPEAHAEVARARDAFLTDPDARAVARLSRPARVEALGPRAVLPLLEDLVVRSPHGSAGASVRRRWSVMALEALGASRDPRALEPVLGVVLHARPDLLVVRAATRAAGAIDCPAAAARLVAATRSAPDRRQLAVLAGLGACPHPSVVRRLGEGLASVDRSPDALPSVRHLARAAAELARSLARPGRLADAAVAPMQDALAESLVAAYRRLDTADARRALAGALIELPLPLIDGVIERATRGSSGGASSDLDELRRRVARSPHDDPAVHDLPRRPLATPSDGRDRRQRSK